MTLSDALLGALASLRGNPARTGLTTLGIVIGVAAVVAMLAVGEGAKQEVRKALDVIGPNMLIVGNGSRDAQGQQRGRGQVQTLTEGDVAAMRRELPEIAVVAGSLDGGGHVVRGHRNWVTSLRGITPEFLVAQSWQLAGGRTMTAEELRTAARVVLLGRSVVLALFGQQSPLGQSVRIENVPFLVIGELRGKGPTPWGRDLDDVVLMPLPTARQRVFGTLPGQRDKLAQVTVRAAAPELVASVQQDLQVLLRRRHQLRPDQADDFFISNIADAASARTEASRVMSNLLAAVAAISLLVGGIGIMNIMLVSVVERTREIGLRVALGATSRDIQLQFAVEAVVLAGIGGVLGVLLGGSAAFLIAQVAGWPTLVGPIGVAIALGAAVAVGVVFGFYPARQAALLDPIDALRRD